MDADRYFGRDYPSARATFLNACRKHGVFAGSFLNENGRGPDGEPLLCDTAYWGDPDADKLIVVSSGTHGAEAGCGSAIMSAWIDILSDKPLPDDVAVLFIHTLNPWGFAHMARTTEDNVDLNRNFIDFDVSAPENADYAMLHSVFTPKNWGAGARDEIFSDMRDFHQQHGDGAFLNAMRAGQYQFADGIGYGGRRPAWSRQIFEHMVKSVGARRLRAAYVDLHTGVGEYAKPAFICFHEPQSDAHKRAAAWWGLGEGRPDGQLTEKKVNYNGTILQAFPRLLPGVETTVTCLEFGTLPMEEVQLAIIADNWLRHPQSAGKEGRTEARAFVRNAFCPDDPYWRGQALNKGVEILNKTVEGISAE